MADQKTKYLIERLREAHDAFAALEGVDNDDLVAVLDGASALEFNVADWEASDEYINSIVAKHKAAEARADELAKALEPFAGIADRYDQPRYDDHLTVTVWGPGFIKLGDLRRARAALATHQRQPSAGADHEGEAG